MAAQLQIYDLPEPLKHGLFAEPGVHPAVVRFSDFGDDSSTHKLARMAVKAHLASAWAEEVNLLFTETIDTFFGITDFDTLSAFAGDASLPWYRRVWEDVRTAADLVRVLLVRNFGEVVTGRIFTREALAKDYYGQLPYMLGEKQAMKFALIPLQRTCGEDGADATCCLPPASQAANASASAEWASGRARVTAEYLAECDAVFDLQLKVKEVNAHNEKTIMKRASALWDDEPVTVGRLTIPKQECSADWAVSLELQQRLAAALGVQEGDGIDKMFAFHPILTHEANRPVGEVNTFRAAFYSQHAAERFSTMHDGVMPAMLGTDGGSRRFGHPAPLPAKVPFQSLTEMLSLGALPASGYPAGRPQPRLWTLRPPRVDADNG